MTHPVMAQILSPSWTLAHPNTAKLRLEICHFMRRIRIMTTDLKCLRTGGGRRIQGATKVFRSRLLTPSKVSRRSTYPMGGLA